MDIHYNQVGYDPALPKRVVLTGKGDTCAILRERGYDDQGEQAFTPVLSPAFYDEASGDTVRIADFSAICAPGRYYFIADGKSITLQINKKPYRALCNALVKGFYYQRCGCALPEVYAGPWNHGPCHEKKAVLINDEGELDPQTAVECAGGWHDAGDYGRYTAPAAVAVAHLLYSYELFPGAYDDELNIPESGNGVPDILNECRYELEWMLKMQRADGGVYHKVTTRYFAPFIMPENDTQDLCLFKVSHCSTAGFAAVMAQASRVFRAYDANFAGKTLAAAEKAWGWLEANPQFEPFANPPNVSSGGYGDANGEDELFWASAELFSITGGARYAKALQKRVDLVDISQFGWRDTAGFGALCCLFVIKNKAGDALSEDFFTSLKARFIEAADSFLDLCQKSGYGTALAADNYKWGSILPILNNAIAMICAGLLTGDKKYRNAAQKQLDYLLGLNATGYCFVTGFGDKPYRYPHHRPSYADGIDEPVPGLVSGGPNNQWPDKAVKALMPADTPPAKFYLDYTPTPSTNEIAIYWNSPAVFVAAYFSL